MPEYMTEREAVCFCLREKDGAGLAPSRERDEKRIQRTEGTKFSAG